MKAAFILIFLFFSLYGCNRNETKNQKQLKDIDPTDTAGYSLKVIESLHERLTFRELDKSLVDYIRTNPNRVDSIRNVVYLLPFGNMKPEIEQIIRAEVKYLMAFLQLEVKILERIPYDSIKGKGTIQTRMVPSTDFDYFSKLKGGARTLREQIQASSFIENTVKNKVPKDAVCVLGITEHDIYDPNYNFLFGLSLSKARVGLVSTFRLIDYGNQTKNNIRKVISKQIVNMFSIPNVKDYKCLLNFHDHMGELIDGTFDLSPRALEKLRYATKFHYVRRCNDLRIFWENEQNQKEAKYYQECLERISKQGFTL